MKMINFLIFSNLLVSCSSGTLAMAVAHQFGNPHPFGIGFTVFFATLFVYNFQRIARRKEMRKFSSIRHEWIAKNINWNKILAVIGLLGAIVLYFFVLGFKSDFWLLAFSAVVGVLYVFQTKKFSLALRDIPYMKIYLIALQWSLVAVIWPYMRLGLHLDFPFQLFLTVFFFVLAATVPFDIRDLVYDSPRKRTIPQIFGVGKAKLVALIFLAFSGVFYLNFVEKSTAFTLFFLCYSVMALFIIGSSKDRNEIYYSGGIDGWIMVFAFLIYGS